MDVVKFLSLLTLLSNIFVLIVFTLFLLKRFAKVKAFDSLFKGLSRHALTLSLVVALTATLGSLYLSEVRHFEPCKFCWLQRIFMYPLVFILSTALIKRAKDYESYVLPLSTVGMLLAGYHYYMQVSPKPLAPCSVVGFSVSCTERFFTHYGYITIPWMSLSAFALIILYMLFSRAKLD